MKARIVQLDTGCEKLLPFARSMLSRLWQVAGLLPAGTPLSVVAGGGAGEIVRVSILNGEGRISISGGEGIAGGYAHFIRNGIGIGGRTEDILPWTPAYPLFQSSNYYLSAFANEILVGTYLHSVSGHELLSVTYHQLGGAVGGVTVFPGSPSAGMVDQVEFLTFQGQAAIYDQYSGTFKNYGDPLLNTEPRAAGSHSFSIVSNPSMTEYLVTHALKKSVYNADGAVLCQGLSPGAVQRLLLSGSITTDAPDYDMVAADYGADFVTGDRLVLYRLEAAYDHNGFSGTTALAGALPDDVTGVELKERYEYLFVAGYMGRIAVTGTEGYINSITANGDALITEQIMVATTQAATAALIVSRVNAEGSGYRAMIDPDDSAVVRIQAPAGTLAPYSLSVATTNDATSTAVLASDQAGFFEWVSTTSMNDPVVEVKLKGAENIIELVNFDLIFYETDEVRATATITPVAPASEASSVYVEAIRVDGAVIAPAQIVFDMDPLVTAGLIVEEINATQDDYRATRVGAIITLTAAKGTGADPNGFEITWLTNDPDIMLATDFEDGAAPVEGPMRPYAAVFYPKTPTNTRAAFLARLGLYVDPTRYSSETRLTDTQLLLGAIRQLDEES